MSYFYLYFSKGANGIKIPLGNEVSNNITPFDSGENIQLPKGKETDINQPFLWWALGSLDSKSQKQKNEFTAHFIRTMVADRVNMKVPDQTMQNQQEFQESSKVSLCRRRFLLILLVPRVLVLWIVQNWQYSNL